MQLTLMGMFINLQIQMMEHGTGLVAQGIKLFQSGKMISQMMLKKNLACQGSGGKYDFW